MGPKPGELKCWEFDLCVELLSDSRSPQRLPRSRSPAELPSVECRGPQVLAEDVRGLGRDSGQLPAHSHSSSRVSALSPGPNSPPPQCGAKWQVTAVPAVGGVLGRSSTLWEPEACVSDSEVAWPLPWRETFPYYTDGKGKTAFAPGWTPGPYFKTVLHKHA